MKSRRFTASASRASDEKDSTALLRCGISIWLVSLVGQQRPSEECPRRVRLYLDEPTSIAAIFTAGQCQKATYAAQLKTVVNHHLVGAGELCRRHFDAIPDRLHTQPGRLITTAGLARRIGPRPTGPERRIRERIGLTPSAKS